MSRVPKRVSETLLWLSGADPDVLRHCERERGKFVAMGGTVVTTSVLATIAATFTVHEFLHAPLLVALVIGVGWGFAIMNLDRWLLISIRRQGTWWKTVLMALPRVFLALIIGIVIAEPLVLRVFEGEVNAQAFRDKQEALAEGREEQGRQYAAIPRLKAREDEIREALTGVNDGAALLEAPEYKQAAAQLRRLETRADKAEREALCELDGSCGTSKAGAGGVYATKQRLAEDLRSQAEAERAHVADVRARLLEQEGNRAVHARRFDRRELRRVEEQLERLRAQHQQDARTLREEYHKSIGLLDRVEALGNLTDEHPSMKWIRIILFLFILAVDSLPAIAKVLMSLGKPSLYETVQAGLEEADAVALSQQTAAHAEAGAITAGTVVKEAETRKEFVESVQTDLIRQAVDGMREAGEKFVAGWRRAVVDSVDDLVDAELKRTGLRRSGGKTTPPPPPPKTNGGAPEGP